MRGPDSLHSLVEQGVIDEVVRPLMSGKEAQVYLVVAGGELAVAKIYKEAKDRTFKHRSEYTEGRRVRNTRDRRAMDKHSRHGRSQEEATWRTAEVETIYRLRDAGVRVPEPKAYIDNVLVMELVTDLEGNPAPRLADLGFRSQRTMEQFESLLREVVKMLCAGLVHGDLSEFNILAGANELVIIDFPQAVDAAANRNARKLLIRDVGNLTRFFGSHVRGLSSRSYGEEIWDLYERGQLTPESPLTGRYQRRGPNTNVSSLLAEMAELVRDSRPLHEVMGLPPPPRPESPPRRRTVEGTAGQNAGAQGPPRRRHRPRPPANKPPANKPPANKPPANKPVANKPAANKPAANKPPASRPPASRPAASRPAASRPAATGGAQDASRPQRRDGTPPAQPSSPPSKSRRRRRRGRRKKAPVAAE